MWYVVWRGSNNGYQQDQCLKEIELHAQNMITTPNPLVDLT